MAAPIAARGMPHSARRDRRSDAAADTTSRRASCAPSPTARAARMARPVRGSVCNCFAASCFLHYQSDAARRFVDHVLSCAAGAAAQAPLGLNAGCKTAFMDRVLERQGSRIGTPFGAWFSHPTHLWCMVREAAQAASFAHNTLIVRRSARRCRAGNSTTKLVARPSAHRRASSAPPCRRCLRQHRARPPLQLPNWWRAQLRTAMTAPNLVAFDSP